MKNKQLIMIVFVLVCAVQLYVPAKMILDHENVLKTGAEYKFKTAPVDPNDPFRGKYVTLRYDDNVFFYQDTAIKWNYQEDVFVEVGTNQEGFAEIINVTKTPPEGDVDYFRAGLGGESTYDGRTELFIDYPFDRYYMEESKASDAETAYAEAQWDTSQVAYALVRIKDGNAVLKDVLIDDVPIKELVEQAQKNSKD